MVEQEKKKGKKKKKKTRSQVKSCDSSSSIICHFDRKKKEIVQSVLTGFRGSVPCKDVLKLQNQNRDWHRDLLAESTVL